MYVISYCFAVFHMIYLHMCPFCVHALDYILSKLPPPIAIFAFVVFMCVIALATTFMICMQMRLGISTLSSLPPLRNAKALTWSPRSFSSDSRPMGEEVLG